LRWAVFAVIDVHGFPGCYGITFAN